MDYGHDSVADTIESCYVNETQVSDLIKGFCNTIHNSTMFTEHQHLLVAALSALKATQNVLDSNNDEMIQGHA